MTLKKQTIWLITMLSLIVVLSVYYVTAPSEQAMYVEEEEAAEEEALSEDLVEEEMFEQLDGLEIPLEEDGEEEEIVSSISSNDAFTSIRMDLQASRDEMQEQLNEIVASNEASAQMKSKAHDENMALLKLAQQEATLESLIKAKGYDDALVVAEEDQVRVLVQADALTKEEANDILRLTFEQLGADKQIAVSYQP